MSTTLEQELEQAAGISETLAKYLVETNAPNAAASALGVFSARLRARAAWVREGAPWPGWPSTALYRSLTGPIPAAETATSERKEP